MAATAIVVVFEAAEPAVARWRREHTRDGADGMPAHVTLLFPFVDDAELAAAHLDALKQIGDGFAGFAVRFETFGRFDASPASVLYLEPDPPEPFIALTGAIVRRFPGNPPYGGAVAAVIPHLTIVETGDARVVDAAEQDVRGRLPIVAHAGELHVMEHTGDHCWRIRATVPLAPAGR